ncbi:MAG: GNAT family N-acetyltransferase [Bdellovibrionota bacterium]
MAHEIQTERLRLRPLREEDYDFLLGLYADAEVMKYISTGVRDRHWKKGIWHVAGVP